MLTATFETTLLSSFDDEDVTATQAIATRTNRAESIGATGSNQKSAPYAHGGQPTFRGHFKASLSNARTARRRELSSNGNLC
jgi:hypothetical protein